MQQANVTSRCSESEAVEVYVNRQKQLEQEIADLGNLLWAEEQSDRDLATAVNSLRLCRHRVNETSPELAAIFQHQEAVELLENTSKMLQQMRQTRIDCIRAKLEATIHKKILSEQDEAARMATWLDQDLTIQSWLQSIEETTINCAACNKRTSPPSVINLFLEPKQEFGIFPNAIKFGRRQSKDNFIHISSRQLISHGRECEDVLEVARRMLLQHGSNKTTDTGRTCHASLFCVPDWNLDQDDISWGGYCHSMKRDWGRIQRIGTVEGPWSDQKLAAIIERVRTMTAQPSCRPSVFNHKKARILS